MKTWRKMVLFYIGGCVYVGLELLWRGRSHGSMFVAGGVCFILIGHLGHIQPKLPLIPRALVGSGIITMVELATGLLVNREHAVWDYRELPGNFMGQICPLFSILWVPIALLAILLHDRLDETIQGRLSRPLRFNS